MSLQLVAESLDRLQAEWEGLLALCSRPNPFAHPAFQRAWLAEFQGDRELLLWSVRDGERLIGVAPLLRDGGRVSLSGDPSVCDYMDVVCTPGFEEQFMETVLGSLASLPCRTAEFWGLHEDSPALRVIEGAAARAGFTVTREREAVAPAADLPGAWEEYLSGLSKKDRHELRRKIRRFATLGGGAQLRVCTEGPDIENAASTLRDLMAQSRQDKAEFLQRPRMEAFFERVAIEMGPTGLIRLYVLDLDARPVAAVLCFAQNNRLYMYNSGYDPAYAAYSVGLVSKAMVIEDGIANGFEKVDFLRGDESYKYDLGGRDQVIQRCILNRA